MMVINPFLFIAGNVALDFVNTEAIVRGERTDLLADEADLARWIAESGLERGSRLRALHDQSTVVWKAWLEEAKELRTQLRRMFLHLTGGGALRSADSAALNRLLGRVDGHLAVDVQDNRLRIAFASSEAGSPGFLIARAVAEFLAAAELSLIKRCEGSGCILLFYDVTKSHTRRWCSMAVCGNRTKAAAHYERKRGGH